MMKKRKSGSVAAPKEEPAPVGKVAAVAADDEDATKRSQPVAAEVAVTTEEEGWRRRAGLVVSEEVPVGAMWLPSWDVGNMAESYVTSFYSDVWDGYDDIWGLRSPPQNTTNTNNNAINKSSTTPNSSD